MDYEVFVLNDKQDDGIGVICDHLKKLGIERDRRELISTYFSMFYPTERAMEVIDSLNKNVLRNDYKSCINIDSVECDEDFLCYLSHYRKACCADDKWEDLLKEFSSNINSDPIAFFYELVQNADDCKFKDGEIPSFEAELYDDMIKIHHNELGMTKANIIAISSAGESDKDPTKIGEKGIGFKTVFAKCDRVDIVSGGYSFSLVDGGFHIARFTPPEDEEYKSGTTMWLHFKKGADISADRLYDDICNKYGINGDRNMLFSKCPVMFTNKLRSISVRCGSRQFTVSTEKSYTVLPREKFGNDNGSVTVTVTVRNDGKERTVNCFGIYEDVIPTLNAVCSRYKNTSKIDSNFMEAQRQRIEIIAALDNEVARGNMYSFLPCDQAIKAPVSVQLPVKLNINRTRMFFIGDSDTSATNDGKTVDASSPETILWNEEIIEEFIGMLPRFYKALREELKDNPALYRYIPDIRDNGLFLPSETGFENYMNTYCNELGMVDRIRAIPFFPVVGGGYCNAEKALVFDSLICTQMGVAHEWAGKLDVEGMPVESSPAMLKYGERVGLKKFEYPDKDTTTRSFNVLIEETNKQSAVFNTLCEEHDIYEHVNKAALRVFPAATTKGRKLISGNGIWFVGDGLISRDDCFFHFAAVNEQEKSSFEAVGIELIPVSSKTDVLNVLCDAKDKFFMISKLEELCLFLNDYGKDTLSYCEQLLTKPDDELAKTFAQVVLRTRDVLSILDRVPTKVYPCALTEEIKIKWNLLAQKLLGKPLDVTLPSLRECQNEDLLKEICSIINDTDADKVKLSKEERLLRYQTEDMKKYERIGISAINICKRLPVPYMFLGSDLILQSEEALEDAVSKKAKGFFSEETFKQNCKAITGYNTEASTFAKHGKLLEELTEVAVNALRYSGDFTRAEDTEYKPEYELLQNADGKCKSKDANFAVARNGTEVIIEYTEETGFSLWDFYCITVRGVSNQDEAGTGKFGTGFKSIYSVCPRVEIFSRDIKCVLDTRYYPFAITPDDNMCNKMKRSPVPQFSQCDREHSDTTMMRLCFDDESKADDFYNELICPENYVFLRNISYPFGDYPYSEEKGFYYSYAREGNIKPLFEVYFPLEYNKENSYPMYCLLPMSQSKRLPFFLNLPQILTNNERTDISRNVNREKNEFINKPMLKDVFEGENGLKAAFEAFAKAKEENYKFAHSYASPFEINMYVSLLYNTTFKPDFKGFEIYPCKQQGTVTNYVSMNDITDIWSEIKVFSGIFYEMLGKKGIAESDIPEDILYLDSDVAELIGAEENYSTILDKLYDMEKLGSFSADDVKFINDCLPFLREELYSCDDELIGIVKRKSLWALAQFNHENGAADYFKRGDVAFWTLDEHYRTYEEGKKYYRLDKSDGIVPVFEGKDRVICGLPEKITRGCDNVIELMEIFDDEDDAKEFLQDESEMLIEVAIDKGSCYSEAFELLNKLINEENADKKLLEKYIYLIQFILKSDKLETSPSEIVSELIKELPGLYGNVKEEIVSNYFNTLSTMLSVVKDTGTVFDTPFIAVMKQLAEHNTKLPQQCYDLLEQIFSFSSSSDLKGMLGLYRTNGIDPSEISGILGEYTFHDSGFLEVLVGDYIEHKDEFIYDMFLKSLDDEKTKISSGVINGIIQLAEKDSEKYRNVLAKALIKCAEKVQLDSAPENIFMRLSEKKEEYRTMYNIYQKISADISYCVFKEDGNDNIVYFLETAEEPCIIDATLDGNNIVIVLYSMITEGIKRFLGDKCNINNFMVCERIAEWGEQSDCTDSGVSFTDEVLEHAEELLNSDEETLINELVAPYEVDGVKFSGYGRSRCCPICRDRLLAQASALTVENILIHRRKFPLLMCGSCADFMKNYTTFVGFEKLSKELLMQSDELTLEIDLDEGRKMKENICIDMPFLHRAMLYRFISEEQEE